jgi:hypothetical protein
MADVSLMSKLIISKKFWEDLIACFPFTTYRVFDATRTAQKTPRPTAVLLLRVYSLPRESVYPAAARKIKGGATDTETAR